MGLVFDIQKFSVHDGPGIRTTVFLKGCPLRCRWCHNPESWMASPQILYSEEKCVGCGHCVNECSNGCHTIDGVGHSFGRDQCVVCGKCVKACLNGALELCGREMTAEEVISEVLKDKVFYETSGGGMTISGGEPLTQFEFTQKLLEMARGEGIGTAVETCGFAPQENYAALLPLVDLFLWDVKAVDDVRHREYTGQSNGLILSNLRFLAASGAAFCLRCPVIPGLNDSDVDLMAIAELAESLHCGPQSIDVEPYHPLGVAKARRLGQCALFEADFPEADRVQHWCDVIAAHTSARVRKL